MNTESRLNPKLVNTNEILSSCLSYSLELIDISETSTNIHLNASTDREFEQQGLSNSNNNKRYKRSLKTATYSVFISVSNQLKYGNYKPMEWTIDIRYFTYIFIIKIILEFLEFLIIFKYLNTLGILGIQ